MILRITNNIDWGTAPFPDTEFGQRAADALIRYNTRTVYKRKRYDELRKKYIEKIADGVPLEKFHDSYMGMLAQCAPLKGSLVVQIMDEHTGIWFVPPPSVGSTWIPDEEITTVFERLKTAEKHLQAINRLCHDIAESIDESA